jgi:hypothetical protein
MAERHEFLSDEWIEAARRIRDEHAADVPAPPPIRMNLVVTEVPFGSETLHAHVDTTSGSVHLEQGHLERVDVTVSTDYRTSRSIFVEQDPTAAMQAMFEGRIRVQGDLSKLLALQAGAAAPDDTAKLVARKIKEITAE